MRKECISAIVQEAVTEKNLNTILNKRVLARQIPVQSKVNQKTSVKVRIRKLLNFVLKYYPDFVTKIQSCTQYQLQIFNHEFLDNFILGKYQLLNSFLSRISILKKDLLSRLGILLKFSPVSLQNFFPQVIKFFFFDFLINYRY